MRHSDTNCSSRHCSPMGTLIVGLVFIGDYILNVENDFKFVQDFCLWRIQNTAEKDQKRYLNVIATSLWPHKLVLHDADHKVEFCGDVEM